MMFLSILSVGRKRIECKIACYADTVFVVATGAIIVGFTQIYMIIAYIAYLSMFLILYSIRFMTNKSSVFFLITAHSVLSLCLYAARYSPYFILLALAYITFICFLVTPHIEMSRAFTFCAFPVEMLIGYFMAPYGAIVFHIVMLTLAIANLLAISLGRIRAPALLTIMLIHTLLCVLEPLDSLLYSIIMLSILSIHGYQCSMDILILGVPSFIIIEIMTQEAFVALIPATAIVVLNEVKRIVGKRGIFHPAIVFSIQVLCTSIAIIIRGANPIRPIPVIYFMLTICGFWVMHRKYVRKEYSLYIVYSAAISVPLILLHYGLRIETTILLTILGFLTIACGINIKNKSVRLTGLGIMTITLVKGIYDIVLQITLMQMAPSIRMVLGFGLIGLALIASSYLYAKFYGKYIQNRRTTSPAP